MTMFMIDKRPGVSIEKEEFESRLGGNIGSIETESDEEMDTLLKDSTTKNPFTRLCFARSQSIYLYIVTNVCMLHAPWTQRQHFDLQMHILMMS